MKISRLNTEQQVDTSLNRALGIQTYGEGNDYPQRVMEIVEASTTGSSCVDTYRKFIAGRGFENEAFYRTRINRKGQTVDDVLRACAADRALFGGFALHINYNALYEIVEVTHIPLEWLRFGALNEDYTFNELAMHPDWGRRYTALRRFSKANIERFHFFDPTPATIDAEVEAAGGWANYNGQIFYFSNRGERVYPSPLFRAALTDMSNEEGLSNITQRNVRHNFLPAGMLVDYDNSPNSDEQKEETKRELVEFQGDMKAGQLMYVNVRNGEGVPEFKPFVSNNYDKAFTNAEEKTPEIIGRAFVQPPILRAEDIGAGFGADLMENAYEFYNSITAPEREEMEGVFKRIFSLWHDHNINSEANYTIMPLRYRVNTSLAEVLGDNTDKVVELLYDASKSEQSKRAILSKVYGLDDEDINELIEGVV